MSDWRDQWQRTNRENWDERVPIHVSGEFYDVEGFKAGAERLRPFELAEVGDVAGKDLVHLQCHFGVDTLNWARRGARVTGLDFSAPPSRPPGSCPGRWDSTPPSCSRTCTRP